MAQASRLTNRIMKVKHGLGRLTAAAEGGDSTRLTQVSHKAPLRWIPVGSSNIERAGASVVALSNYGAGLLPGDRNDLDIKVQAGARLGVISQGSNRIYGQKKKNAGPTKDTSSHSTLQASVEKGGLLVVAPDPTVPFASSSFEQNQEVVVDPSSSAVLVDWFSSGRFQNGERWDFSLLSSRTSLHVSTNDDDDDAINRHKTPLITDATILDQRNLSLGTRMQSKDAFGFDMAEQHFNAFATVFLYGEKTKDVLERLEALQEDFAGQYTRLRERATALERSSQNYSTSGRVVLGVNKVDLNTDYLQMSEDKIEALHVARMVGRTNEDLYRVLHHCLLPLAPEFGFEFYKDRIRAFASAAVPMESLKELKTSDDSQSARNGYSNNTSLPLSPDKTEDSLNDFFGLDKTQDDDATWFSTMLSDAALPTGSFAHSSGIEAAHQLGLLVGSKDAVSDFVALSTRSTTQLSTPWILAGHNLCSSTMAFDRVDQIEEWKRLDNEIHSVLACTAPACRASLDQGRNLLRVVITWLEDTKAGHDSEKRSGLTLLKEIQQCTQTNQTSGHFSAVFGIVSSCLHLSPRVACENFGYCVARDVVSAAVRLNLIGPMASVGILANARLATKEGIAASIEAIKRNAENAKTESDWNERVNPLQFSQGGCSPIIDAIHPCHDMLAVRLFRT